jgi:hypothetical protein
MVLTILAVCFALLLAGWIHEGKKRRLGPRRIPGASSIGISGAPRDWPLEQSFGANTADDVALSAYWVPANPRS